MSWRCRRGSTACVTEAQYAQLWTTLCTVEKLMWITLWEVAIGPASAPPRRRRKPRIPAPHGELHSRNSAVESDHPPRQASWGDLLSQGGETVDNFPAHRGRPRRRAPSRRSAASGGGPEPLRIHSPPTPADNEKDPGDELRGLSRSLAVFIYPQSQSTGGFAGHIHRPLHAKPPRFTLPRSAANCVGLSGPSYGGFLGVGERLPAPRWACSSAVP